MEIVFIQSGMGEWVARENDAAAKILARIVRRDDSMFITDVFPQPGKVRLVEHHRSLMTAQYYLMGVFAAEKGRHERARSAAELLQAYGRDAEQEANAAPSQEVSVLTKRIEELEEELEREREVTRTLGRTNDYLQRERSRLEQENKRLHADLGATRRDFSKEITNLDKTAKRCEELEKENRWFKYRFNAINKIILGADNGAE